jgi:hypothetical protein
MRDRASSAGLLDRDWVVPGASERRRLLLWIWNGAIVAATAWAFWSAGMTHPRMEATELVGLFLALPTLFTGLGSVIAAKKPGNRIAWLFLAMGLSLLFSVWADFNVPWISPPQPTAMDTLAVVWFNAGFQVGLFIPLGVLMHIFPTGSFLTPRWAWAGWAAAVGAFTSFFAEVSVIEVSPNFEPSIESWVISNPFGFTTVGTMANPIYAVALGLTVLPLIFGGVASLVLRYRRSDAIVKAQIRWVVLALILFVLIGVIPAFAGFYGSNLFLALLLVPVAVTIAITRYRLFEIDRLISRTVGYAIVIGLLGLVFTLIAVVPGLFLGGVDTDGTPADAPSVLVAASTLAVAALFNPLRLRVLRWVDRRFNRSRYDAETVIDGMTRWLVGDAMVEDIADEAVAVVIKTMEPVSVGVWVRE